MERFYRDLFHIVFLFHYTLTMLRVILSLGYYCPPKSLSLVPFLLLSLTYTKFASSLIFLLFRSIPLPVRLSISPSVCVETVGHVY